MSEDTGLILQSFNINELAGATGLILGAVSGILVVIFKSRCYCKFRVGCSDNCNVCMCERKPPPDPDESDDEGKDKKKKKEPKDKDKDKETKDEQLVPTTSSRTPSRTPSQQSEIDKLV